MEADIDDLMAAVNNFLLCTAEAADLEALALLLHDADEGDARIRAALSSDALSSYAAY